MADNESELVSVREAQEILGISHTRMAELIRVGELAVVKVNPRDRREKLLRRSDVMAWLREAESDPKNEAAA
jgi:excisionase family DNA binding protein